MEIQPHAVRYADGVVAATPVTLVRRAENIARTWEA
jgi:hypothetical protein